MEKLFKLPKPFAEKWLIALRSGKYKQGRSHLVTYVASKPQYCAIGVALKISGLDDYDLQGSLSITEKIAKKTTVPHELTGHYRKNKLVAKLTELNDLKEASFHEIADWIESNVEFV